MNCPPRPAERAHRATAKKNSPKAESAHRKKSRQRSEEPSSQPPSWHVLHGSAVPCLRLCSLLHCLTHSPRPALSPSLPPSFHLSLSPSLTPFFPRSSLSFPPSISLPLSTGDAISLQEQHRAQRKAARRRSQGSHCQFGKCIHTMGQSTSARQYLLDLLIVGHFATLAS